MIIFNGKKAADEILSELKEKILQERIKPRFAVISVGDNPASRLFIKNKKRAAKRIGVGISHYKFKETAKEAEVIKKIEKLNQDFRVNGIIVQLPLPKKFNQEKITERINLEKDVDGFCGANRALLEKGEKPYFYSPFPLSVLVALKSAVKNFKGKRILAVVNSKIFGQALKSFLKLKNIEIDFILKKKLHFLDLKAKLKSADVIITACGCPKQLKREMIKEGAVLIDGGITLLFNGKVAGDADRESVEKKASFLTPVPGGIGPLTVAMLLKNVYLAAKKHAKHRKKH